jgi:hypothetical protein
MQCVTRFGRQATKLAAFGIPGSDHLRRQTIPIHIVATGSSLLPVSQNKVVHARLSRLWISWDGEVSAQ